jgi:hypothetical protein
MFCAPRSSSSEAVLSRRVSRPASSPPVTRTTQSTEVMRSGAASPEAMRSSAASAIACTRSCTSARVIVVVTPASSVIRRRSSCVPPRNSVSSIFSRCTDMKKTPMPTRPSEITTKSGRSPIQLIFGVSARSMSGTAVGSCARGAILSLSIMRLKITRVISSEENIVATTPMPSVIAKPLISWLAVYASTTQTMRFVTFASTIVDSTFWYATRTAALGSSPALSSSRMRS